MEFINKKGDNHFSQFGDKVALKHLSNLTELGGIVVSTLYTFSSVLGRFNMVSMIAFLALISSKYLQSLNMTLLALAS